MVYKPYALWQDLDKCDANYREENIIVHPIPSLAVTVLDNCWMRLAFALQRQDPAPSDEFRYALAAG
jgi:hypothetical protein